VRQSGNSWQQRTRAANTTADGQHGRAAGATSRRNTRQGKGQLWAAAQKSVMEADPLRERAYVRRSGICISKSTSIAMPGTHTASGNVPRCLHAGLEPGWSRVGVLRSASPPSPHTTRLASRAGWRADWGSPAWWRPSARGGRTLAVIFHGAGAALSVKPHSVLALTPVFRGRKENCSRLSSGRYAKTAVTAVLPDLLQDDRRELRPAEIAHPPRVGAFPSKLNRGMRTRLFAVCRGGRGVQAESVSVFQSRSSPPASSPIRSPTVRGYPALRIWGCSAPTEGLFATLPGAARLSFRCDCASKATSF